MKIKPQKLNIPEGDPFKEDILEREESAKILTQFISTIKEPYVLAIDSPWGTGKTTFIQMWAQSLKNDGYPCIHINAWENDFSDDPLVSLIGEIDAGIKDIKPEKDFQTKAKESFVKVIKFGAKLTKKAIPIAVKTTTAGILDTDVACETALSELSETIARDAIKKYSKDKATIKEFKESLSKFVEDISPTDDKGNRKPLVLFIDELDRCRPDFAIELLEKAKHFFNIDNIIFVLAIDKEQLGHSIRSMYGVGMNVDGYLRRFIDLEYSLPEPSTEAFCSALFNKLELTKFFEERMPFKSKNDQANLFAILTKLFKVFNLSLRDQEQCISRLSIVLRTTERLGSIHPFLLGALLTLKTSNPKLYTDYTKGYADAKEVLDFIGSTTEGKTLLDSNYGYALEAYFTYAQHDKNERVNLITKYQNESIKDTASKEEKVRAKSIHALLKELYSNHGHDILKPLTKKIEIAKQFVQN